MDHDRLLIWQRAMDICVHVYELTKTFPQTEVYGLTAQLRRSGVSIASNIAEGEGRLTRGERRQALSQARGSLSELDTQMEIAQRLNYTDGRELRNSLYELRLMIDAYIAYIRR